VSEHKINLNWQRTTDSFEYKKFNRNHLIEFKNGHKLETSAAVSYLGDANCVDPEEAFVASLSSCHMLTFLAFSALQGFCIDSYQDNSIGILEKNANGKMAITKVTLSPKIEFTGDKTPSAEEISKLHHKAHEECFIANSVHTKVEVN
jgi:organic hydroperoxide reductase OsmC/OhrA